MIGAPFIVMRYVDGEVLRSAPIAATLDLAARRRVSDHLVDVLVALHDVDVDAVGLGDLARRDGYIERQLRRWWNQYERSVAVPDPLMAEVHRRLIALVPVPRGVAIVHGDFRLENAIVAPDGEIRAVLDWELCTLGDPMADVGMLQVYWAGEGETAPSPAARTTAEPGFPTRSAMAARYGQSAGRNFEDLDYYVAFAAWKIACIMQGVLARYPSGNRGGERTYTATLAADHRQLCDLAATTLGIG